LLASGWRTLRACSGRAAAGRDVAGPQRKVKDLLQGVTIACAARPQKISLDGRDFTADRREAAVRGGDERLSARRVSCCGDGAVTFQARLSGERLHESEIFWLGNATTASATSDAIATCPLRS